ncbi:hypothetical protein [Actinomadura atramentaria]|uniref:hypothetical protein n=1 Tax=Actinomadura atramentaria TaxID=1990 RepID=UPI00037CEBF8|nr:hypothetical protein [Actinomadura atramentaria]
MDMTALNCLAEERGEVAEFDETAPFYDGTAEDGDPELGPDYPVFDTDPAHRTPASPVEDDEVPDDEANPAEQADDEPAPVKASSDAGSRAGRTVLQGTIAAAAVTTPAAAIISPDGLGLDDWRLLLIGLVQALLTAALAYLQRIADTRRS